MVLEVGLDRCWAVIKPAAVTKRLIKEGRMTTERDRLPTVAVNVVIGITVTTQDWLYTM